MTADQMQKKLAEHEEQLRQMREAIFAIVKELGEVKAQASRPFERAILEALHPAPAIGKRRKP